MKLHPKIKLALKVTLAGGVIWYIQSKGAFDLSILTKVREPLMLLSLVACLSINILLNNWRWQILLRAKGILLSFWAVLRLSIVGLFFNYAMPGGLGGDFVKGAYIWKEHPEKKISAVMSILMDRLAGFLVMTFTASIAILYQWRLVFSSGQMSLLGLLILGLGFSFALFFVLALSKRVKNHKFWGIFYSKIPFGKRIEELHTDIHSYRNHSKELAQALLVCFVSQFFGVFFYYLLGESQGLAISFSEYVMVVPVGSIALALPISPAGVGAGQLAYMYLFRATGHAPDSFGPMAVSLMQLIQFILGLPGALLYLQTKKHAHQSPSSHIARTKSTGS